MPKGEGFTLRNGKKSERYIDVRTALLHRNYVKLIASSVMEVVRARNIKMQSVGGMESGCIPLAVMVSQISECNTFYVRKNNKEYGLRKRVEGYPTSPCLLVEDVITTGMSLQDAAAALIAGDPSCIISAAIAVVDREERELDKIFEDVPVYALIKASELL